MINIPEFYESDAEWEARENSEGAGQSEYDNLKHQRDRILRRQAAPVRRLREMLEQVAAFDFLSTLDAAPTPQAREAYTQLMVNVRLALRDFKLATGQPDQEQGK